MFGKVKKHLTPSIFIALIALVFAVTGGAFAASSHGGGSGGRASITTASVSRAGGNTLAITAKKKKKATSTRGPAGPKGATGATGPAGAQGAAGAAGPAGAKGENGAKGEKGEQGTAGTNGTNGTNGTIGFTKTLPSGETLKGDWSLTGVAQGEFFEGLLTTAVSFGIPLVEAPAAVHLIPAPTESGGVVTFPTPPGGCTGNVSSPGAEKGNLCVFAREELNLYKEKICAAGSATFEEAALFGCFANASRPETADPSGFEILVEAAAKGIVLYDGTWAVTAE